MSGFLLPWFDRVGSSNSVLFLFLFRFQLFGDTVNCAARMESNGSPNLIQASQKTADLLTEAGKHHWLKRRDEFIEVKGKGTMQTYWVEPPQSRAIKLPPTRGTPTPTPSTSWVCRGRLTKPWRLSWNA